MKKYYAVSFVLFIIAWVGITLAERILGGETPIPLGWLIFLGSIILNALIAMLCFMADLVRGKI